MKLFITIMKSKIHRATVIQTNLNYMGSITVDRELMKAADIVEYERVQVVNLNNGARLETYLIASEEGSGYVCLNGAAARWAQAGDKVIIISYCMVTRDEALCWQPKIVNVDKNNKIIF
jgi:aspartate 1-decarboxylase